MPCLWTNVLGCAPFFLNPRSLLKRGAVFLVTLTLFVISTNRNDSEIVRTVNRSIFGA